MSTQLRRLGPYTWLAELAALRIEPRTDLLELGRFSLYAPDGCTAIVTDRLRLELISVSLEGPVKSPFLLEIRSAVACGADWPVIGGVVGVPVLRGFLVQVDFGPTTEWSIWGAAPAAPNRMSVHLRAVAEHCCALPHVLWGQLSPKPE